MGKVGLMGAGHGKPRFKAGLSLDNRSLTETLRASLKAISHTQTDSLYVHSDKHWEKECVPYDPASVRECSHSEETAEFVDGIDMNYLPFVVLATAFFVLASVLVAALAFAFTPFVSLVGAIVWCIFGYCVTTSIVCLIVISNCAQLFLIYSSFTVWIYRLVANYSLSPILF